MRLMKKSDESSKADCHHFWICDSANGATSLARCKLCGETKEFWNVFPDEGSMRQIMRAEREIARMKAVPNP